MIQQVRGLDRRKVLTVGMASVLAAAAGAWAVRLGETDMSDEPLHTGALPMLPPLARAALRPEDHEEYRAFRARFITSDGRVVDTVNGHVSHSEGQGWGMLMAVAFDDEETFDRLHAWTRRWLRRPSDRLHAWRYQPNAENPVSDTNNATDGDMYIAGALARAARHWDRPDLAAEAAGIGRDILRILVRQAGPRLVLLPGAYGFEKDGGVIVNPSYYAFPLIRDIAAVAPSPVWSVLRDDGLRLIGDGRFGPWGLPPDWLRIDRRTGELAPAPGWPARFSYDAIRIPLHLAWSGLSAEGLTDAFFRYWRAPHPFAPAWADLASGTIAPYPAEPGTQAVARLVLQTAGFGGPAVLVGTDPSVGTATDYYSAALIVLARLAQGESRSST